LEKDILIIEDSQATSLLITEFLKKLGYEKIHSANTGKNGLEIFQKLVNSGMMPIVLLDYSLPDTNANEIISELFKIKPDVKIILETAEEKEESVVKEAIRKGVYIYLQKPIRFDNIKNTMKIVEEETANKLNDFTEIIESCISFNPIISIAKLSDKTGKSKEELTHYLKDLESSGKIIPIQDLKEIACNFCNSVNIERNFLCPSCKSSDFTQGKLIEHFKCGNISSEVDYKDDKCPKCRKEIKIIGVDYRIIDNYYICKNCQEKFPEPLVQYICGKCNNKFTLENAKWVTSQAFKVIN
jgi:DNA-binding response OmpR family regulator/RNA polymerase subunit RPABC4/transcription elongation factor Spt4